MPRKIRPPANTTQNRENQRRSRARRREHLACLEARVRAFETAGARATLHMQRAAREVAWVNARLLELLAVQGVGRGEVEGFLRRCREREGGGEMEMEMGKGGEKEKEKGGDVCGGDDDTGRRDAGLDAAAGVGANANVLAGAEEEEEEEEEEEGYVVVVDRRDTDGGNGLCSETPKLCSNVDDEGERALVTPCDDAANIIAGFQGHGDISRVRKALGCGDATDCHVKNTRVFQLMDEMG